MKKNSGNQTSRHIVFIDIENVAGNPSPCWQEIDSVQRELLAVIPDLDLAQVIIASSHIAAEVVGFSFPKALRRWRSGVDGADLALIDEMTDQRTMVRYSQITICSGDGIFTDHVARLSALGPKVTVIARRENLSAKLRLVAPHVIELSPHQDVEPAVAIGRAA